MPQEPDASFAPDIDVDDSKKYIGQLLEIEERPSTSQYKKSDKEMTEIFKWRLFDMETGVAVLDNSTDEPFVLWQFRRDTTHHNKSTGQIGESREVANALLNKELTDDEVHQMNVEGWSNSGLIGKRVVMDLEWGTTAKGYPRLKVLRLKPYTKKQLWDRKPKQKAPRLDEDEE